MRITLYNSSSEIRDSEVPVQHRAPMTKTCRDAIRTPFEHFVLDGLSEISKPKTRGFLLSAGVVARRAEEDMELWETGYRGRMPVKKNQLILTDAVYVWLTVEHGDESKSFLVARIGFANLYERLYKGTLLLDEDEPVSDDRKPYIVREFASFIHWRIVDGAKALKAGVAEVASDLWLQHERAMANYRSFGMFLSEFAPS